MSEHILKCVKCERYTMHKSCPSCGADTVSTVPAKFSPIDAYGKYRREVKRKELEEKGWL